VRVKAGTTHKMQLPTEHTVRGDLPQPCSEESDVRLIILVVVESRAARTLADWGSVADYLGAIRKASNPSTINVELRVD
jgi:hypothetical protein